MYTLWKDVSAGDGGAVLEPEERNPPSSPEEKKKVQKEGNFPVRAFELRASGLHSPCQKIQLSLKTLFPKKETSVCSWRLGKEKQNSVIKVGGGLAVRREGMEEGVFCSALCITIRCSNSFDSTVLFPVIAKTLARG